MQKNYTEIENLTLLSNAGQLFADVIERVAGNDISNHHDGAPINQQMLSGFAAAAFNKALNGGKSNAQ